MDDLLLPTHFLCVAACCQPIYIIWWTLGYQGQAFHKQVEWQPIPQSFNRSKNPVFSEKLVRLGQRINLIYCFSEPGLLEALKFRVEAAEQKFRTAQLDDRLKEFEAARQRQVKLSVLNWCDLFITFQHPILNPECTIFFQKNFFQEVEVFDWAQTTQTNKILPK